MNGTCYAQDFRTLVTTSLDPPAHKDAAMEKKPLLERFAIFAAEAASGDDVCSLMG